jgi:hypothetical protein
VTATLVTKNCKPLLHCGAVMHGDVSADINVNGLGCSKLAGVPDKTAGHSTNADIYVCVAPSFSSILSSFITNIL